MPAESPKTIYLKDYQPFTHVVEGVTMTFRLHPTQTRVKTRLSLSPNPARPGRHDLHLHGEAMRLISARIGGRDLGVAPQSDGLILPADLLPEGSFVLETEVEISPEDNTALEGLYISGGLYCTQCEAEGFRRITYYPDRPDVMAPFTVRIESDQPVQLSNGNPTAQGDGWAEWVDPWPKPSYLFALVAGDLVAHRDSFVTRSGRKVELAIWVRMGDEDRCAYAMDSLIRSMKWDEDVYGREYDLDVFNIVAVDDANMGAMENKGLNIFNSRLVLASPETATDRDYGYIESVIAHEYFHNWTGNRITCRDWFQLSLKEGLTVLRDQQFSADMRSADVQRISDVIALRDGQFREDQGPLAHPVRPESFVEINNFYTSTVYEKGAEVIGMLKRLVGEASYSKALDLYFDRHDGQAATVEDWLKVFEDATGRDLTQFKRWYAQAGTPIVGVTEDWQPGEQGGTYVLTLTQTNPPTPGQPHKDPKVIPIAVGLLNPNGDEVVPTRVLELTEAQQSFAFVGLAARPVPSILRGFSAPIVLERDVPAAERAFLLAHDTDAFNRWEAGRLLARDTLMSMVLNGTEPEEDYLAAMARLLRDDALDPAFRALAVQMPEEDGLAARLATLGVVPDPVEIRKARQDLILALARRLGPDLPGLLTGAASEGAYSPDAVSAGRRALRLAVLALLARLDGGASAELAFASANNMTDETGALAVLIDIGCGAAAVEQFESRWSGERLVMNKWFALQVSLCEADAAARTAERLTRHPLFDWKNPDRFRSVFEALAANHAGFHHSSGAGYALMADWLVKVDAVNPQSAARVSTAFETWQRYDAVRKAHARTALERMAAAPGLSGDMKEMVQRLLGA